MMKKILFAIGTLTVVFGVVWAGRAWTTLRVNARTSKFNEDVENLFIGLQKYKERVGAYPIGSNADVAKALQGNNPKNVIILVGRKTELNEKGEYVSQFSAGTNPIGIAVDSKGNVWSDNENETGEIEAGRVSRLIFCTGPIYYDLIAARDERNSSDIAIARIEQLYPFGQTQLNDLLLRYPLTCEVVWVQEEPRNMGAWWFIREQIEPLLVPTRRELRYVGRPESASPATGSLKRHQQEQAQVVEDALTVGAVSKARKVKVMAKRKR